jgi:hypothetical protein
MFCQAFYKNIKKGTSEEMPLYKSAELLTITEETKEDRPDSLPR